MSCEPSCSGRGERVVAGGRGRGRIHRRDWFHRRQHKRSAAHTTDTVDTADTAHATDTAHTADIADGTDTAVVAPPDDSGDQVGATADESAPPASFDQVLRRAAEARDHERDSDD
jgi:hypothetical protein